MGSESKMLFKASNAHELIMLSFFLTFINLIVIGRFVIPSNSYIVQMLLILLIVISYFGLAHIAFKISYFYTHKIEMNYTLRLFKRKKRVIEYSEITKAIIYEGPIRESPFLKLRLKDKRFPLNIKYLNAEKIKVLKDLFNEKQIKFKAYSNWFSVT